MSDESLKYPLRAFLDLSITHLDVKTVASLRQNDIFLYGVTGGEVEFGWFIYAPEERPEKLPFDDLWVCLAKAREMGARYVLFDADADTAGQIDLPAYDHTDPTLEGWVPAF